MVNVPDMVSPLYWAVPWDWNVPSGVEHVVVQVIVASRRFMPLTWQDSFGLIGTDRLGSMQFVKLPFNCDWAPGGGEKPGGDAGIPP